VTRPRSLHRSSRDRYQTQSGHARWNNRLSVVLPNYNHARYLSRAINAIAEQTTVADEIIVIDDASTDGSRDVLLQCQGRHPNLAVLLNQHNSARCWRCSAGWKPQAVATSTSPPRTTRYCRVLQPGRRCTGSSADGGPVLRRDRPARRCDGEKNRNPAAVRPLRKPGGLSAREVEDMLKRADNFIHTGSTIFRRQALLKQGGFVVAAGSFSDGLLARKVALAEGCGSCP